MISLAITMTRATSPPQISIIMPCLNGELHIQNAIDSVLEQTFDDFELIVVDNGSTDRTPEILAAVNDTRLRVLSLPERGVGRARNMGLRAARGAFIAFLDSDDTWDTKFLEKTYTALVADSKAVLAYCGWQNLGVHGPREKPYVPPEYEGQHKVATLLNVCPWPIHAVLTRKNAIVTAGGFNTQLVIAEDYLLWMEVAMQGVLLRVPEVLAQYRHHDGVQATHNHALTALETYRAKQIFLRRNTGIFNKLGPDVIEAVTWGNLINDGNTLHWRGDIQGARPVFRKALLAGKGALSQKLRMLPSLLPISIHRFILRIIRK